MNSSHKLGGNLWSPPGDQAANDFRGFSSRYPLDYFRDATSELAPRMLQPADVARRILQALEHSAPFSCVRLSDGEGNIVMSDPIVEVGSTLKEYCLGRISYIHFGDYDVVRGAEDFFFRSIRRALLESDVMGMPEISSIEHKFDLPDEDKDVRAIAGTRSGLVFLRGNRDQFGGHVSSCWINRHLLPSYRDFLQASPKTLVVTSYQDLGGILGRWASLKEGQLTSVGIPGQATFLKAADRRNNGHYPEAMQKVEQAITESDASLVLVAAGLLGKHYCGLAKRTGKVAIDIGSVPEIWLGIPARGLSEDFINRWKIVGG